MWPVIGSPETTEDMRGWSGVVTAWAAMLMELESGERDRKLQEAERVRTIPAGGTGSLPGRTSPPIGWSRTPRTSGSTTPPSAR